MLSQIKDDIKKNYYDPTLKGIDIESKFKTSADRIQQATAIGQMSGIIAQFMLDFDDSHLFFFPPQKINRTDYGFELRMVGDKCYVVSIDEQSDAAQKGLKIGDQILGIEGFAPTRESFWKLEYYLRVLRPRPKLMLAVVKPDGSKMQLEPVSKITEGRRILNLTDSDTNDLIREEEDQYYKQLKQYYYEKIPGLFIWKMPRFTLEPGKVDAIMNKAKKSAMILDLRGNGGGSVEMLLRLIGNFFPEDIKVYDEKSRKQSKEIIAKSRKKDSYDGKLVVLIDSDSASASEVFSRVMQLEKRGVIVGDLSAGAVMESMHYSHTTGLDTVAFFGASITFADLIMKDGKSIEKVGITPDERVIPTGRDLAEKRDVALARAVELLGFKMSPEEAGKAFPNDYYSR
jgi:C-terminal processing protease CtpA/Prc